MFGGQKAYHDGHTTLCMIYTAVIVNHTFYSLHNFLYSPLFMSYCVLYYLYKAK